MIFFSENKLTRKQFLVGLAKALAIFFCCMVLQYSVRYVNFMTLYIPLFVISFMLLFYFLFYLFQILIQRINDMKVEVIKPLKFLWYLFFVYFSLIFFLLLAASMPDSFKLGGYFAFAFILVIEYTSLIFLPFFLMFITYCGFVKSNIDPSQYGQNQLEH